MQRSVGIIIHRTKPEALALAVEVIDWLKERNIDVSLDENTAIRLGRPALACREEEWSEIEFLITLGGDGTILTAARLAAPFKIPILGVHMGQFGFIAETHPDDLFSNLKEILEGRMKIQERLMISAQILRNGVCIHEGSGLNDVVLKSKMSRLLNLKTQLGGAHFATYPADGIVISTPTGSTGYALSAGGPLIEPTIHALVVVPICPHTLSARPIIVPSDEIIEIEVEMDGDEVIFAVDGVEPVALESGDHVIIRKAEFTTRLIHFDRTTFYRKIRNRYLYGERLNH